MSRAKIFKSRRTWRPATARSDSFAFSRKGCASRAFQSLRTPRRNMLEGRRKGHRREKRREERYGCTYADGGLRARAAVSRARPEREQLIVMCGGRRGILIFPLNATPRTGVRSGYEPGGLRKRRRNRRYATATSLTRSPGPFFTSFLRPRRRRRSSRNCRREEHKRDRI